MASQGCSRAITCLLCLGVKEDQEEQHDVKAQMIFRAGEGREKKGVRGQPGVGEVGADTEGEFKGGREGPFGPGAPGPVRDGKKKKKKNGGSSGSGVEQEQTELVAEGMVSQKSLKPPVRPMARHHLGFTKRQLEQLETTSQRGRSHDKPASGYRVVVGELRVNEASGWILRTLLGAGGGIDRTSIEA
ncbi:homeobox protein Rhox5-like [Arvicola amphibius]|uniref:homeobox protein Rhox5-like n=1 Tax=Arvicola amphibius TaxID=1047088 RepID=UPI001C09EEFC|nr:homeobox protein Rhox5-like [Arvicola amphibius]